MAGNRKKEEGGGLSLAEIAAAVEKDSKGQLDVEKRLASGDSKVAFELICIAIYKAFRRRGGNHTLALKSTKQIVDATDIKVVIE